MPMLSGMRDSGHAAPISGKRPIAVSGMAKRYFSPATRCVPNRLMPTPDPITAPSMSEMVGLEKHSCSQLSAYSSSNASRARARSSRPQRTISRTSPPAQNALSLADWMTTQ